MGRLLVAVDGDTGVSPAELAQAWEGDGQTRSLGPAQVDTQAGGAFFPDVTTLVVIPLAVNVASTAACALISKLIARLRHSEPEEVTVEVAASGGDDGDVLVVVRVAGRQR